MFGDLLPLLAVGCITLLALTFLRARYPSGEFHLMFASLVAHAVAAFLQIYLVYFVYRTGDMLMYDRYGVEIGRLLRQDFLTTAWQVLLMFLQQDTPLAESLGTPPKATASMIAVVAIGMFLLGDSLAAVSSLLAVLSWLGKIALFEGMTAFLDPRMRKRVLVASVLVPSVVFWSSGIVKEGVAIGGLGLVMLGWATTRRQRTPGAVAMICSGLLVIGVIKPHLLVGGVMGVAAWGFWRRSTDALGRVHVRPIYLLLGIMVAVSGMLLIGKIFPRFAVETIAQEAAEMQFYGTRTVGGSRYTIGDPLDRSFLGQLAFMPVALFTALYRPLPFEATNPQMLVNAVETVAFLFVTAWTLWRRGLHGTWRELGRWPILVFLLVFVLTLGAGVGLVSNTLGTLSRYRMPMVPFFATLLLVLSAPVPRPVRQAARRDPWIRPIDRERVTAQRAQTS